MTRFSIVLSLSILVGGLALVEQPRRAQADDKCGEKGQPSCPLQGWMEKNMQAPYEKEDLKALEKALKTAAGVAPDKSWNDGDKGWKKIAEDGAKAAAAGDFKAVKATCKTCHKAWRKKYKAEHRLEPIKG